MPYALFHTASSVVFFKKTPNVEKVFEVYVTTGSDGRNYETNYARISSQFLKRFIYQI